MASLAMGLMGIGTILSASGASKRGFAAQRLGEEQKAIYEVAAGQAVAVGQHRAAEEKRQSDLMASRALAIASAGGAAQDVDNLIADINGEGLYRANMAMYEAETEAERLKFEGSLAVKVGDAKQRASENEVFATLLSGGGKMLAAKSPSLAKTTGNVPGDAYQPARRYG